MTDQPDFSEYFTDEKLPDDYRSGYVAVAGRPNVGKSTLMNYLLGEKVAIVSPKPQTTRDQQLGILTLPEAQIIFVDTPGIHQARSKLGDYMVNKAQESVSSADVAIFLVDISRPPDQGDQLIAEWLTGLKTPVVLVLNKSDLVDDEQAQRNVAQYHELVPEAVAVQVSATQGTNCDQLLQILIEKLPHGPRLFPADQLTDTWLRDNVAEIIREKILMLFEQEVPHAVAVKVDEFKERTGDLTYIRATIFVERDSQKAIVIGKGGSMLKKVGKIARADIQELLETKVYLDLWVKVLKNWRKDENAMRRLGYDPRK